MHKALTDMNISQYFNRPKHTLSYFLKRNKAQRENFKFLNERHAKKKACKTSKLQLRLSGCISQQMSDFNFQTLHDTAESVL